MKWLSSEFGYDVLLLVISFNFSLREFSVGLRSVVMLIWMKNLTCRGLRYRLSCRKVHGLVIIFLNEVK